MTPAEQLDAVLDTLKSREEKEMTIEDIGNCLSESQKSIVENVLQQVLNKLEKDGYIYSYNSSTGSIPQKTFKTFTLYKLTFEGHYFIQEGKYKEKLSNEASLATWAYIQTLFATLGAILAGVGGFVAAIYYLHELLKK